eukprot:TRINITY_DN11582_c0_g2_i4.p1 TRINITY_DN11582_c0_g2~~TRINITY_DN11582_c0_g2_i4.p1  ORF type:complete len:473 (+),score=127.20 TRINITY_DN11582_c0_g2_i4:262-1680(+)
MANWSVADGSLPDLFADDEEPFDLSAAALSRGRSLTLDQTTTEGRYESNDWSPAPCHTPLSSQGIFDDDFDEDDDDLFGNNEFFDDEYAIMNNISPSLRTKVAALPSKTDKVCLIIRSIFQTHAVLDLHERLEYADELLRGAADAEPLLKAATYLKMADHATQYGQLYFNDASELDDDVPSSIHQSDIKLMSEFIAKLTALLSTCEPISRDVIELEQTLAAQQATVEKIKAELEAAQANYTATEAKLQRLESDAQAAQKSALDSTLEFQSELIASAERQHAAYKDVCHQPVRSLKASQAYVLVAGLLGVELEFDVFNSNDINGAALVQLTSSDLEELFGLKTPGLHHRLLHCIKLAADNPRPELLQTDFDAAVERLCQWLTEQNAHVAQDQLDKLCKARIDIVTCQTISGDILAATGIPFKDRKPLLMLLHSANSPGIEPSAPPAENTPRELWTSEVQQAVLEQVPMIDSLG